MGWEQRGNNRYYYRKEREGSKVKSVYVGRGEIAHMISRLQTDSPLLEALARLSRFEKDSEKVDAVLEQTMELIALFTHASLLMAGFHTHHRQWRRKRNVDSDGRTNQR